MKAQFRTNESSTPCEQCAHIRKGQAGKFCGRKSGHYINFVTFQKQIKSFDTPCLYYINKYTNQTVEPENNGKYRYLCLSLWQPWAYAITHLGKDIENRNWRAFFRNRPVRGEFLLHAAKKRPTELEWWQYQQLFRTNYQAELPGLEEMQFGGIVGKANLVDCVAQSSSKWFMGKYGFVLRDQKPLDFIPLRGQQMFFEYFSDVKL